MRRGLFFLVASIALLAGSSSIGSAAISPCGTAGSKFAGASPTGIVTYGAKADISLQDPALCDAATGSPSTSSAWTMLVEDTPNYYLAQTGYIHAGSNWTYAGSDGNGNPVTYQGYHYSVFTEWTPTVGVGDVVQFFAAPPPSNTNYQTGYSFNDHRINMWQGTTQLTHTNYDPSGVWQTPWEPQFYGETHHCESDVPGTSSAHVTFSHIEKKSSDGTWSSITTSTFNRYTDCTDRYNTQWDTKPHSFDIWTGP